MILEKIKLFFKEVWTEAKRVDWPTRNETINHTLIVVGITLGVAFFLGALDFIFIKILSKIVF